jgi:hypothetical protein
MEAANESQSTALVQIAESIVVIRGQRVLLDEELAALYGVTTRRLNEQVRRNRNRFPSDFLIELTEAEFANLMSQSQAVS